MKRFIRPSLVAIPLLALTVLAVGACMPDSPRDSYNACDWPNHCGGDVVTMLNEIGSWAKEEMLADRAKAPVYDLIIRNVARGKSPDLTNKDDKHVCLLTNPDPCQELRDIHSAAQAAKSGPADQAKAKWEEIGTRLAHWPSGT